MSRPSALQILVLATVGLVAASAGAQHIYQYKDANGNIHYSDSVPPEDAKQDRTLLNNQGVKVGEEQGEITPEEQAEIDAKAREEAERARVLENQHRHDRMLLDTYVEVKDIENLRDRRLEQLDGQVRVFEIYLGNLHKHHDKLIRDAERFAPRNPDDNAAPLPDNLALDIQNTEASIHNYEQLLEDNRENQESIREDFEKDIARFRELKRLPPPSVAETASASVAGREVGN